jgi:hypothetical protein
LRSRSADPRQRLFTGSPRPGGGLDRVEPSHLAAAIDRELERLREGADQAGGRRAAIERELSLLEVRERRLTEAIARGQALDPILAALEAEEARRQALRLELDGLAERARASAIDRARLKRRRSRTCGACWGGRCPRPGRCSRSCSWTGWR